MVKKRKSRLVLILLIVLILIPGVVLGVIEFSSYKQVNIFADIHECEKLENMVDDTQVPTDRHLKDSSYENAFAHEMKCDNKKFTIYAYEFEDVESAVSYYAAVVRYTPKIHVNYTISTNLFVSSKMIVMCNENVYRIECGNVWDLIHIRRCLDSVFTINIQEQRSKDKQGTEI